VNADSAAAKARLKEKGKKGGEASGRAEAWQVPMSKMLDDREYRKAERAPYFDEAGEKIASSRMTPRPADKTPLGTWKVDSLNLNYGRHVEQLRELDPKGLVRKEEPGVNVERSRADDAERYAEWAKEGNPLPPITVLEGEDGRYIVSDGHRRHAAALKLGVPIRAWVSPMAELPGKFDSEGRPLKAGLTQELAVWHALNRGEKVPPDVLKELPDLAEKYGDPRAIAIPVRAEGDAGPRQVMSDTPGAVQGKASKSRRGDCS
jgi:hypothetical protein